MFYNAANWGLDQGGVDLGARAVVVQLGARDPRRLDPKASIRRRSLEAEAPERLFACSFDAVPAVLGSRTGLRLELFELETIARSAQDHLVDLVAEGVDVALRAGSLPPDSTAFLAPKIASMRRVLVAAPRWLRKHGTPRQPRDLARARGLMQVTPAGRSIPWVLVRGDERITAEAPARLPTSAPAALRDLAVAGAGIAHLPDWLVSEDLALGGLRRVLPGWSSEPLSACAVHRKELRGAAKLRVFLDALRSSIPSVADASQA